MKARLARYAPVQLMDYMIERGGVTLAMGLLFGWILVLGRSQASAGWSEGEAGLRAIRVFFVSTLGLFTMFGTLTAVNGMISNDRVKGTFRFLFSKPVGVLPYYAQAWVVHGVGLLAVVSVLMGLFSVIIRPFFPPQILLFVGMTYVLVGGIGFLLSAITKRDGTMLVVFWLLSLVLRARFGGESGLVPGLVKLLTPPAGEVTNMVGAVVTGTPIDMAIMWTSLAYGAVCFTAGLAVLRYRSMTL